METSNIFSSLDSRNAPFPAYTPWTTANHDNDHLMTISSAPQTPRPVNNSMPSLVSDCRVRLALCLPQSKSFQDLSVLEHIPGIEIIGIATQRAPDQESSWEPKNPDSFGPSSTLLLNQTPPDVLLDFTGDPHLQTLRNQEQSGHTEIPGPFTASLVKKLIEHKHALEGQMAQIEKLANIGTLASGILHDINNPLYVVLGFSEILLEENNSEAVKEQALEVYQATKRIIKMCEDLNLYARQHTPAECLPVDLTRQIEEAMKVARFSVGLENMRIERTYSAHPVILARPEEIVQIFVNLIINALQAMDGQGTLTLGVDCTDLTATISIGDTGPGIPQELMRKIFEPFYTTKPPGKGTGLGLYSVRSLVQRYGGQINIYSVVGEGTTFHLEFPLISRSVLCQNG